MIIAKTIISQRPPIKTEVTAKRKSLLVNTSTTSIAVTSVTQGLRGAQGAQGAKGDRGDPGPAGGDLSYLHEQPSAADTWTINHSLGKYPSVTIVDSAGDECEGNVNHISTNQVVVTFSAAFAGRAFLN